MWGSFITGFANKSVELVEEKDNEIKKNMELQLKDMYASRSEAKKKAETRRDELRTAAAQLKSFGLDDTGVIKVLSSGNYDNIAKLLQNEAISGTLTPQKVKSFIGEAEPNIPPSLEEFFNQSTRLTAAPGTKPISTKAKTAFGFDTNAAQDVTERFLKSQNLTAEELQQSELAAMPMIGSKFDYGVLGKEEDTFTKQKDKAQRRLFAATEGTDEYNQAMKDYSKIIAIEKLEDEDDPETFNKLKNRARLALFNATTKEERNAALSDLTQITYIENVAKGEEINESNVRASLRILESSIIESMAGPQDLIRYTDPATGESRVTIKNTIDPKLRKQIENERVRRFKEYVNKYYTNNGRVPEAVQRVLGAFILNRGDAAEGQATQGTAPTAPTAPTAQRTYTITTGDGKVRTFNDKETADKAYDLYIKNKVKATKGY